MAPYREERCTRSHYQNSFHYINTNTLGTGRDTCIFICMYGLSNLCILMYITCLVAVAQDKIKDTSKTLTLWPRFRVVMLAVVRC